MSAVVSMSQMAATTDPHCQDQRNVGIAALWRKSKWAFIVPFWLPLGRGLYQAHLSAKGLMNSPVRAAKGFLKVKAE